MIYVTQPTAYPTRKIGAVGIGGALSVLLVWVLESYVLPEPLPAEVIAAISALMSFACGYFVRENA